MYTPPAKDSSLLRPPRSSAQMQLTINKSAQCSSQDVVHDRCCFHRLVNHGLYPQAGAISFSQRAHCPLTHFAIPRKK